MSLCLRIIVVTFLLFPVCSNADKYQDTVENFKLAAGSQKFDKAYGYAVFPNIGKGGIGIGAAYGRGKVYVSERFTGNVTMRQITVGFQFGGQAYSQIIFFEDLRAYNEFTASGFEFSAQASAVALTLGANLETSTKGNSIGITTGTESQAVTRYYKGMAVYTLAKGGLMYEAAIGGQKFDFRSVKNFPAEKDLSTGKLGES